MLITVLLIALVEKAVHCFSPPLILRSTVSSESGIKLHATIVQHHRNEDENHELSNIDNSSTGKMMMTIHRRSLLLNLLTASSTLFLFPTASIAGVSDSNIPSVTSAEFDIILKDSAKSILTVELSGPKSETALVRLVDGTTFSISDLIESSTDPRSPLKLVARCRLYKVPVKNTGILSALSGEGSLVSASGKKTKSYMNPRVQEAERKEKEKRERMMEDERERLVELYRMEESEEGLLK